MKIKITEAGNEAFTGWIGDVEFANGVSVSEQPEQAIAHVGAIFSIELIEDVETKTKEVKAPVKTETPVEEKPVVEETTAEDTPAEDAPAEDAPAEDAPADTDAKE